MRSGGARRSKELRLVDHVVSSLQGSGTVDTKCRKQSWLVIRDISMMEGGRCAWVKLLFFPRMVLMIYVMSTNGDLISFPARGTAFDSYGICSALIATL